MSETYTIKEAMDTLKIKSKSAFFRLEKKYPEAFVILKSDKHQPIQYDKGAIDKFAKLRAYYRLERR
jgi:hypothetical protein